MITVLIGAFLFGVCLGSFANVCIWRLPRPGLSPSSPARSHCPRCGFLLPWYDNLPIISWCLLQGNCRRCGGTISIRYTLVEVITGLTVVCIAARLITEPCPFVLWTALGAALIVASFIDLELMILPDEIVVPAMGLVPWLFLCFPGPIGPAYDSLGRNLAENVRTALGGGLALGHTGGAAAAAILGATGGVVVGEYVRKKSLKEDPGPGFLGIAPFYLLGAAYGALLGRSVADPASLTATLGGVAFVSSLAGAAAGAGVIWGIRVLGRYAFAQEAMGFGDVKLMALLGAITGIGGTFWIVILASILGSVIGVLRFAITRERHLPFGPFLIGAAAVVVSMRTHLTALLDWYGKLLAGGS